MALRQLKATELKTLAALIGSNVTGSKDLLHQEIIGSLQKSRLSILKATNVSSTTRPSKPHRILSIDMGIRNLAYAVLDIDQTRFQPTTTDPSVNLTTLLAILSASKSRPTILNSLRLHDWQKTNLTSTQDDLFDPPNLAPRAYDLVTRLLTYQPDTVLIERQRHRSGGSSAILEWTVRVNLLEGMLWASFETLRRQGLTSCALDAVNPMKVARFWADVTAERAAAATSATKRGSRSKAEKEAKIGVVEGWLEAGALDCSSAEAEKMQRAFLEARAPGRRRRSRSRSSDAATDGADQDDGCELPSKVDDLADCLLQGVTWVQWEANRQRVADFLRDFEK